MKYYARIEVIDRPFSYTTFVQANVTSDNVHFERRVFEADTCGELLHNIINALPSITSYGNELDVTFGIGESEV